MLSAHKKGAVGELTACVWLIDQGYEVFRNVTPDGPIDLIAIKEDELIKIDVKRDTKGYGFGESLKNQINDRGVRLLAVDENGNCQWQDTPTTKSEDELVGELIPETYSDRDRPTKLTKRDVALIRRMTGPTGEVAKTFGVSPSIICKLRRGVTWKEKV